MAKKPSETTGLTKGSSPKTSPELQESDLDKVSGGIIMIDGVKGESSDDKHKDTIHVSSFK